jgi:predicted ATPase with chaperone activity
MLAQRLTTILPAMSLAEAIDTAPISRIVGLTSRDSPWRPAWGSPRPPMPPAQT